MRRISYWPPIFHHIQPVTTLTDIPLAMPENEDRSAKAEVCPSPETDFDGGWATLTGKYNSGLFLNIDRNNWGCATSRVEKWPAAQPTPSTPLYAVGGRIFILSTSHSFTLTRPASPRK